jgi:acyl-CoA thioester hydrolase
MKDYATKLTLRIDWADIDAFGHINNVAIMNYIQAARVNYLESIHFMQVQPETKIGPILASVSCRFLNPLFYPGQVTVYSKVDLVKNTSFRILHSLVDDKGMVAAEAQDIIVLFDFGNGSKLAIPEELRARIAESGQTVTSSPSCQR